jgi:pseudouridine kinase
MVREQQAKRDVLLIGGSTYDITGIATGDANLHDSNPSRIFTGCGGAGRNILENAARLGMSASIISAYGTDAFSKELIDSCRVVGIDTTRIWIREMANACLYIDLLDKNGELLLAASDLTLMEELPISLLEESMDFINSHDIVILDTNVAEQALQFVAKYCTAIIIGDTVSIAKAPRFRNILNRMHVVKTTIGELKSLTGGNIESRQDICDAGNFLIKKGVNQVDVTMGEEGACCIQEYGVDWVPGFPANVKNVTGAGDAFCAGIAYGIQNGFTVREILLFGSAMSHIALSGEAAVNPEMSLEKARYLMSEMNRNLNELQLSQAHNN